MVSLNGLFGAPAKGALLGGTLLMGASMPAIATAGSDLPVFNAAASPPAVARVIGPVKGSACQTAATTGGQIEAIDRLKQRAIAEGATAIVDLRVKVKMSATAYLKGSGFPNPCRFETDVKGTAVVLAVAQEG